MSKLNAYRCDNKARIGIIVYINDVYIMSGYFLHVSEKDEPVIENIAGSMS